MPAALAAKSLSQNDRPQFSCEPGRYVVYPGEGMCVVSHYAQFEVLGTFTAMVRCRLLKDPKTILSKPLKRAEELGLRLPSTDDDLKKIFDIFAGKKPPEAAKLWQRRKEGHDQAFATGDIVLVTGIIHAILHKYKDKTFEGQAPIVELPSDVACSYIERELVDKSVSFLASEISHVSGCTERQARATLFAAALIPGHAAKVTLPRRKIPLMQMDARIFEGMFGMTREQAANLEAPIETMAAQFKAVTSLPARAPQAAPVNFAALAHMPSNFDPKPKKQPVRARKLKPAAPVRKIKAEPEKEKPLPASREPEISRREKFLNALTQKNREIYSRENENVPLKGTVRGILNRAAEILSAAEFEILVKTSLRVRDKRQDYQAIADDRGIDRQAAIRLRNDAAEKILASYSETDARAYRGLLTPYVENTRAERPRKSAEKLSKEPKPKIEKAPKLNSLEKTLKHVRPENLEIYLRENENVPSKGTTRGIFDKAATLLSAEEFEILTKTSLRFFPKRADYQTVADERDGDRRAVIDVRNAAAAKLLASYPGTSAKGHGAYLAPHVEKIRAERSPKTVGKTRKEPKPKRERAPKLSSFEKFLKQVPPDIMPAYLRENDYVFSKGGVRAVFNKAASILSLEEFDLFTRTSLRSRQSRVGYQEMAAEMGLDRQAVIDRRNGIAKKLRVEFRNIDMRGVGGFVTPYIDKPEKIQSRKKEKAPRLTELQKYLNGIPAENRPIYFAEDGNVLPRGGVRAVFKKAAVLLKPEEFDLFVRTSLRNKDIRVSYQDMATDIGVSRQSVIDLRNRIAEKLAATFTKRHAMGTGGFLMPYADKPVKTPAPKKEKSVRPPARGRTAERKKRDDKIAGIPADVMAVYRSEIGLVPIKGPVRGLFFKAAPVLSARELSVLTQSCLRVKDHRLDYDRLAAGMGMDRAAIIRIRNGAVETLKAHLSPATRASMSVMLQPVPETKNGRRPAPPARPRAVQGSVKAEKRMSRTEQAVSRIPPNMLDLFESVEPMVARDDRVSLFRAARSLSRNEFTVYAMARLCEPQQRLSITEIAKRMDMPRERVLGLEQSAVMKMSPAWARERKRGAVTREAMRVFQVEAAYVPDLGVTRGILMRAAHVLDADQLGLVSRIRLRDRRMETLEDQAKRLNKPSVRLVQSFNEAVAKLRATYEAERSKIAEGKILKPIEWPTKLQR